MEKDDDWYGEGDAYDFSYRVYSPSIGRFFSTDPIMKSFPFLAPYAFAENKPVAGIDFEGLEFVLRIYSPQVSAALGKAINAGDIYEARRLTNWALHNEFPDNWAVKCVGDNERQSQVQPKNRQVASLTREGNHEGVIVELYGYFNNDRETGKILPTQRIHVEKGTGRFPDAHYPVDVKLIEKDFYAKYDFVGETHGWTFMLGGGGGAGIIQGYLKGWGFVQYEYEGEGYGFSMGSSMEVMKGKYMGWEEMTPQTMAGSGSTYFGGVEFLSGTKWYGYNGKETVWKGHTHGLSGSAAISKLRQIPFSLGKMDTNTSTLFPRKGTRYNTKISKAKTPAPAKTERHHSPRM